MAEPQVAHSVVEMVVAMADRGELSLEALCADLPVDERTLRRRLRGLEWGLFVELILRLEQRLGRAQLFAFSGAVPDISPVGRRILGRFVSAPNLMRFVCRVMGPAMYPMYATTYAEAEREDGALEARLTLKLDDGLRGCRTVFEINGVATAAVPRFIEQPPFALFAQTTERGGEYRFVLQPPKWAASRPP